MTGASPVPPSAVSVQVADVQAQGTLLFLDAECRVVHAVHFRLPPLFHPHAASLEVAIAALRQDAVEQLTRLPTEKLASEVE